MKCSVENCETKSRRLGLCNTHYFRQRRTGNLEANKVGRPVKHASQEQIREARIAAQKRYEQTEDGKAAILRKLERRKLKAQQSSQTNEEV